MMSIWWFVGGRGTGRGEVQVERETREEVFLSNDHAEKRYASLGIPNPPPKKSWKNFEQLRNFMKYLENNLHISKPEDWYRISVRQISKFGGMVFLFLFLPSLSLPPKK
jgi:hypothetical protein